MLPAWLAGAAPWSLTAYAVAQSEPPGWDALTPAIGVFAPFAGLFLFAIWRLYKDGKDKDARNEAKDQQVLPLLTSTQVALEAANRAIEREATRTVDQYNELRDLLRDILVELRARPR